MDPATLPITGDVTYTPLGRNVEDLLNTEDHSSYISGYDTGLFCPDKVDHPCPEAATMFYKLLRSTDWEKRSFSDVKETDWYAEAVETLAGLGVISGYEDGTFKPTRQITRAGSSPWPWPSPPWSTARAFSDVEGDTSWAAPYIYTAHKLGWVNGMGEGGIFPQLPGKPGPGGNHSEQDAGPPGGRRGEGTGRCEGTSTTCSPSIGAMPPL